MDIEVCHLCGNNHSGSCSTELIYFIWRPAQGKKPKEVQLVGSWHKWQNKEKMAFQVNDRGQCYYELGLTLPVGTYEYKYLVDGQWVCDYDASHRTNQYGYENNFVQVYPKKAFIQLLPKNDIKITSNISVQGLKIVGSWDNWKEQIPMQKSFNVLKGSQQNVVYLRLVPNTSYEFKFKLGKQFLIDQKYPTIINEFGTQNNRIITYSERIQTPTGWRAKQTYNGPKNISGKNFQWERVATDSELYYQKVQGHSFCCIGDHIYIFGGKRRGQFVNTLVKINVHQFSNAYIEEVLPNARAYHNAVTYGNKMIIFGGHNNTILQDYYSFNTSEGTWLTPPFITGNFPPKKQKQSCILFDMLLVFFGGYNCTSDFQYQTYYNEISVLDIQKMQWMKQIKTKGVLPKGRFSHTANIIGSDMYVFGGLTSNMMKDGPTLVQNHTCNVGQHKNLNDIWKINLSQVNELVWEELTPKGKGPTARHGHTANVISTFIIFISGQDDKNKLLNDVVVFDTLKTQWIYPIITGQVPRPRYNHAATVHNDFIIMFGGKTNDLQKNNKYFYILKPKQFQHSLDIEEQSDTQETLSKN